MGEGRREGRKKRKEKEITNWLYVRNRAEVRWGGSFAHTAEGAPFKEVVS